MMNNFKIVKIEAMDDIQKFIDARWEVFKKPEGYPEKITSFNDEDLSKSSHYAVYADNKLIAGASTFKKEDALVLTYIWVSKSLRGQGIAKALIEKAEKSAVSYGYKTLSARAKEDNVEFYEKLGFRKIKELKSMYGEKYFRMLRDINE